jgi:hypothetical protein
VEEEYAINVMMGIEMENVVSFLEKCASAYVCIGDWSIKTLLMPKNNLQKVS